MTAFRHKPRSRSRFDNKKQPGKDDARSVSDSAKRTRKDETDNAYTDIGDDNKRFEDDDVEEITESQVIC
jgi:hypothetical protein